MRKSVIGLNGKMSQNGRALGAHSVAGDYFARLARLLDGIAGESLNRAIDLLLEARASGGHVYVLGNGGSASTASHIACDLAKTALVPGHRPLRVTSLVDNAAVLTAWANDTSYEHVFAEQLTALVEPGDVVIAISASGNSPNVIAGLRAAADGGARTIALLGFDGGRARELVDIPIHVPCHEYGPVEDAHLAVGHAMTAAIRHALETETNEAIAEQSYGGTRSGGR